MLGFLKTVFAGPETATKVVSGIAAAIDDNVWSKEERGVFISKLYESTSGSAIARRVIATLIIFTFVFGCFMCFYAIAMERPWFDDLFKFMDEVLQEPTGYIIGFYFLVRALGSLKS